MILLEQDAPMAAQSRQGLMPGRETSNVRTKLRQERLRHRLESPCQIMRLHRGKTAVDWVGVGVGISACRGMPLVSLAVPWSQFLPGVELTRKEKWALDVVVYLIIHARLYNRRKGGRGYYPVSYGYIRAIAGTPGVRALKWLVGMGAVECDGRYIKGEKSYGYKLTTTATSWGYSVRPMPAQIAARFDKHWTERRREAEKAGETYKQQWRVLQSVTLDPAIWPALLKPPRGENRIKAVHRILSACHMRNRNWYFSHDEKTGRCFTNVTNFPADYRKYLRIGGRSTSEGDIANSQPTGLVAVAYARQEDSPERAYALGLVQAGAFYSTVCDWAGLGHLPHKKQKQRVFAGVLFAKDHSESVLWPGVIKRLPVMAACIEGVKRAGPNALALRLQKQEAEIMLGRVFPRLAAMGIAALSLHDGCLVTSEHLATARRVIEEEYEAATDIRPTVRTK